MTQHAPIDLTVRRLPGGHELRCRPRRPPTSAAPHQPPPGAPYGQAGHDRIHCDRDWPEQAYRQRHHQRRRAQREDRDPGRTPMAHAPEPAAARRAQPGPAIRPRLVPPPRIADRPAARRSARTAPPPVPQLRPAARAGPAARTRARAIHPMSLTPHATPRARLRYIRIRSVVGTITAGSRLHIWVLPDGRRLGFRQRGPSR